MSINHYLSPLDIRLEKQYLKSIQYTLYGLLVFCDLLNTGGGDLLI